MADDFLPTENPEEILEADVVETELSKNSESKDSSESPEVETVVMGAVGNELDWTEMINNHLAQIDNLKQQLKKLKEMLQSIYDNDPTYQAHDAKVKEAVKVRNQTKKQLANLPQVDDLTEKITEIKDLMKSRNKDLSDYVQQYARSTGATTLETSDGIIREIIYTAKLVKKNDFRP